MSENGNEDVAHLTLRLLREMRGDITEMRGDITEMRGDITEMRGDITELRSDVDELRVRMERGFARVDRRLDHLLIGPHGREHQQTRKRLDRIERHLDLDNTDSSDR